MSDRAQRITFVSHTNKPGGGELALRRYLEATQLPVRLVTFEAGGVWEGINAEVVDVGSLWGLRRELTGDELVVANSMRSACLTALVLSRRARLVYWVRDGLTDSAMSRLALALTKHVTARRVSHYLTNSRWTASTVQQVLRVSPDAVDVVHSMSGVSVDDLDGRARAEVHSPLRLLYLGRIAPWKAPDLAVHSLGELRRLGIEATLTIAGGVHFGETDYAAEVERLVAVEPAATMVGHVDDVTSLLRQHDVLVHCSTIPEPFGQVIVQGLGAGLPVVATSSGGPVEILAGSPVSLTYEAGNPAGMAAAVQSAVEAYPRLTEWALRRARDLADEEVMHEAEAVLTQLHSARA